jgi:hypothetical protein
MKVCEQDADGKQRSLKTDHCNANLKRSDTYSSNMPLDRWKTQNNILKTKYISFSKIMDLAVLLQINMLWRYFHIEVSAMIVHLFY